MSLSASVPSAATAEEAPVPHPSLPRSTTTSQLASAARGYSAMFLHGENLVNCLITRRGKTFSDRQADRQRAYIDGQWR